MEKFSISLSEYGRSKHLQRARILEKSSHQIIKDWKKPILINGRKYCSRSNSFAVFDEGLISLNSLSDPSVFVGN